VDKLAQILINLKFEKNILEKDFILFASSKKKLKKQFFYEYLIFDLFCDYACFLLAFKQEICEELLEIYVSNIIIRLPKKYSIDWEKFETLFKKRFTEYYPYLQEINKPIDPNNHISGLGKLFSINFIGNKDDLEIIYKAQMLFITKLEIFYGSFLKKLARNIK